MPSPSPRDTPLRALLVAAGVCFVCSLVVAGSVVLLQPRQLENRARERERQARALLAEVPGLSELLAGQADDVSVEAVVVDLASGELQRALDPAFHQVRDFAQDPERTQALAPESDLAGIGRRPQRATVYLVWRGERVSALALPVHGSGYVSTLWGYLLLDGDAETILGIRFYEYGETPGLGAAIGDPDWSEGFRGKRLRDAAGVIRVRVVKGRAPREGPEAAFQVDGISGATRTGDGVTNLVRFWVGPDGFGRFLDRLRAGALHPVGPRP